MKQNESLSYELYSFPRLESFYMERFIDESGFEFVNLSLKLGAKLDITKQLLVRFYKIIDLKVSNLCDESYLYIQIEDVRSWQYENVCYRIVEVENDVFSLLCQNYSVELLAA